MRQIVGEELDGAQWDAVPMAEYLATHYEHDCEWVDGAVRERGLPDEFQSVTQAFFIVYFSALRETLGVRVRPELRVRVAASRFRIPDVTLLPSSAPWQEVPDTPPMLCIEILSPDDSMSEMQAKIADYVAMGVGAIWIVDPCKRMLFIADAEGTHPVAALTLPGTSVRLEPVEIFAELDGLAG